MVHGHGQRVGSAQHELVLGPGVGDVFRSEGEPSAELVEDHRGLVVGVGGSDAVAVSGAERDVGITVSGPRATREKAVRAERFGVVPELRMPMQQKGTDRDGGSGRDVDAADVIVAERAPSEDPG